jgi:hypothetical protein
MTKSLLLILPFLIAADPPGSRVTVGGPPRPLADVAVELGRQANVRVEVDRAANAPVALNLREVPFWDALEQLAKASNQRLTVAPQGPRVTLGGGPYRPVPLAVRGPFRVAARRVLTRVDLDSGQSNTEVQIDAVWEPSFKAFYAEVPVRSVTALDDQGRPLRVTDDGGGKMDVKGFGQDLTVRLANVPPAATRVAQLAGKLTLVGTTQILQFRFDPAAPNAPQERSGVTGTLTKFKKAGRIWIAGVELQYPKGGPEFESFQSYLRDNQVWLERADGTKFPTTDFEIGPDRQGKTTVNYRFLENEKDGLVIADPKDWKLFLRTPGPISEVTVDFELKNIPLR